MEQAALALAQTHETASRGIVYEHPAGTATAQRLVDEMKQVIETDRANGGRLSDEATAGVLRRIEVGAREARRAPDAEGGERAYLSLLRRIWNASASAADPNREADAGAAGRSTSTGLILPP